MRKHFANHFHNACTVVARLPARLPGMKKALVSLAALAVLGAGAYGAWRAWAVTAESTPSVASALVQRGDVEDTVSATGTLQPRDYVDVGTQVSGQLKKLHVEIGQTVTRGQLLAEIDPTVYRSRAEGTEAQLRNQQAQLAERQAQLKLAEQKAQRQANMMREQATTAEAVQSAEAELQSARAQVQALQAQIQQTRSTLRGDQANLEYTKIYAPMAGTVVTQNAKQGQTLNANQSAPVVLRIADLSTMTVQSQVSEADVSRLRVGMPVYFTTLGEQRKRWYGTLRQINPTPEVINNVVLYNALFDVPNADGALMTQMTTQVFFVVAEAKEATVVPLSALRRTGPGKATVNVVAGEGAPETREVRLGVTSRVAAQVLSGLEPGERVATNERPQRSARSASAAPTPKMGPRL
jgi:membrane fusion protein, macrolide-specific efflux system